MFQGALILSEASTLSAKGFGSFAVQNMQLRADFINLIDRLTNNWRRSYPKNTVIYSQRSFLSCRRFLLVELNFFDLNRRMLILVLKDFKFFFITFNLHCSIKWIATFSFVVFPAWSTV